MGLCSSTLSDDQKKENAASQKLDRVIQDDFHGEQDKIKLLLLGAGESGKSTIFKQMKILYGAGFSQEERMSFRKYIWSNVIEATRQLVDAAEGFGYLGEVRCRSELDDVAKLQIGDELTMEMGRSISALWNDPGIQKTWERRSEFQVIETVKEYFKNVIRIASPTYVPLQEDILLARVRTTGIVEERYLIDGTLFAMYDVGGQRNERKKWIHCFDSVNAVIFVCALAEYDQMMFEDEGTNRMVEAINLFDEICNSRWFQKTAMILFLNKMDLFSEKILRVNISSISHFADYSGTPNNYGEGISYFLSRFVSVNKNPDKDVFHHVTCATDTGNISFVMNACKEIILKENLEENGFVN